MSWRSIGKKLKKIAKKAAPVIKGLASRGLGLSPIGLISGKVLSTLKTAGSDYRKLKAASAGKLVSAIPTSELANVSKTATRFKPRPLAVSKGLAQLEVKKVNPRLAELSRKKAENKKLNAALSNLGADGAAELNAQWKANPNGMTWPEYVAYNLL